MKKILPLFLILSSCAREPANIHVTRMQSGDSIPVSSLKGLRVKELFVVLFPRNYSIEEWRFIFDETKQLSANKKRLRQLEGMIDAASQDERANLIGKNADLLTDLGNKSLFMMSWSASDENCRIKDSLKISCRPSNPDNPLNGTLPKNLEPLRFVNPDPVREDMKTPYLNVVLEQNDETKGPWFKINLRLKPELWGDQEKWFKGDLIPEAGSHFRTQDGGISEGFFKYGYSELTLAP